jgi:dynein heavy chain
MVLEAVNIMLGEKTDWSSCKSVIVDINFMDRLKSYDRNNIPEACLKKIKVTHKNKISLIFYKKIY